MTTWVCIASGPSLTTEDIDYCRSKGWKLATCNASYTIVPDCDLFHAMDANYWENHAEATLSALRDDCEIYSGHKPTSDKYGLNHITWTGEAGCSQTPGIVKSGKLSGYQLIQIVSWKQPDEIILLGYDNQITDGRLHHHKEYQDQDPTKALFASLDDWKHLALQSRVNIINCSRQSAIRSFPRMTLEEYYQSTLTEKQLRNYKIKRALSFGLLK